VLGVFGTIAANKDGVITIDCSDCAILARKFAPAMVHALNSGKSTCVEHG
jgi:uncharacterized protein YejL (UPF0352 family)